MLEERCSLVPAPEIIREVVAEAAMLLGNASQRVTQYQLNRKPAHD